VPNVSFDVAAEAYFKFMGRFSEPLSDEFLAYARVSPGQRALDVGCGPGALTARLVDLLGVESVLAIDPSAPFVAATQQRFPEIDVRLGSAEDLPLDDDSIDVALAQLVVHFMSDPVAGLREMVRVTRPGGTVAACVWDHAGGSGPLSMFWGSVHDLDPDAHDESGLAGSRSGHLVELLELAGAREVERGAVSVTLDFATFEEWWETLAVSARRAQPIAHGLAAPLELGQHGLLLLGLRDHPRPVLRVGRPRVVEPVAQVADRLPQAGDLRVEAVQLRAEVVVPVAVCHPHSVAAASRLSAGSPRYG
jgi:SAM-dependent methyltransferase